MAQLERVELVEGAPRLRDDYGQREVQDERQGLGYRTLFPFVLPSSRLTTCAHTSRPECFHQRDAFPGFFERVLNLLGTQLTMQERIIYVTFLVNCFQSLEDEMLRKECLRIVSLPLWHALNPTRLQRELDAQPKLARVWRYLKKKETPSAAAPAPAAPAGKPAAKGRKRRSEAAEAESGPAAVAAAGAAHEKTFVPRLLEDFLALLKTITPQHAERAEIAYCERFVEFLVDLMNQLPTRRYFRVVLEDSRLLIKCRHSALYSQIGAAEGEGRLFRKLVETLAFYEGFEINDYTGEALTDADMLKAHYERLHRLQMFAFAKFPAKLRPLALANVGAIEGRAALLKHVAPLSDAEFRTLCEELALVGPGGSETRAFLNEVFAQSLEKRQSQLQKINEMPLYPNEAVMWDANVVPAESYTGEEVLALPKLNLQFLTIHDYLLRNFNLFRLESAYEIREDLHDAISRVAPRLEPGGDVSAQLRSHTNTEDGTQTREYSQHTDDTYTHHVPGSHALSTADDARRVEPHGAAHPGGARVARGGAAHRREQALGGEGRGDRVARQFPTRQHQGRVGKYPPARRRLPRHAQTATRAH